MNFLPSNYFKGRSISTATILITWKSRTIRRRRIELVRVPLWITRFPPFLTRLFVQKGTTSWTAFCSTLLTFPIMEMKYPRFHMKTSSKDSFPRWTSTLMSLWISTIWTSWHPLTLKGWSAWLRETFSMEVSDFRTFSWIDFVDKLGESGSVEVVPILEEASWEQSESKLLNSCWKVEQSDFVIFETLTLKESI